MKLCQISRSHLTLLYKQHIFLLLKIESIIRIISEQNPLWVRGTKQLILQPEMWLTGPFFSHVKAYNYWFVTWAYFNAKLSEMESYQSVFHHWTFLWRNKTSFTCFIIWMVRSSMVWLGGYWGDRVTGIRSKVDLPDHKLLTRNPPPPRTKHNRPVIKWLLMCQVLLRCLWTCELESVKMIGQSKERSLLVMIYNALFIVVHTRDQYDWTVSWPSIVMVLWIDLEVCMK